MRGLFSPVPTQTMLRFDGRDADVADGDGAFLVELMLEGDAVVGRLEQPARRGGDPVGGGVGLEDREGGDAPAHVGGADVAPGELLDPVGGQSAIGDCFFFGAAGYRNRLAASSPPPAPTTAKKTP